MLNTLDILVLYAAVTFPHGKAVVCFRWYEHWALIIAVVWFSSCSG